VSAFNQLVLENRNTVYNLAYGILGDPDLAAAATKDTFLRALPALPTYREKASKQWLTEIAVNVCQEYPCRLTQPVLDPCVAGTPDTSGPGAGDDLDRPLGKLCSDTRKNS
jgi:RNA polymerase sigma-70 factor (ECF subfamily)